MSTKVYQVNINAIMLALTDPLTWDREVLLRYLMDPALALVVDLTCETLTLGAKPEVKAPSVVAPAADKPARNPYTGKRPCRMRNGVDSPREFRYRSNDYVCTARKLSIGRQSFEGGRRYVWLTRDEAADIIADVAERQAQREARKAKQTGK